MNTMLTLGQSAKATGKSKTTIHNAVKSGKVSGRKNSNGEYQIDPAELFRVYPPVNPEGEHQNSPVNPSTERDVTPQMNGVTAEVDALKMVIKQLETRLEEKDQRIDEKDERITEMKTQLAQSQNLLTDQRSDTEKARAALAAERNKPKLAVRQRRLTIKERLFGGAVPEIQKAG